MKQKSKLAIAIKITSGVLFLLGFIFSIYSGVMFKTSVSTMFQTQNFFNWGAVFLSLWIDTMASVMLFSLGEIVHQLTNQKNVQKYMNECENQFETELPKI